SARTAAVDGTGSSATSRPCSRPARPCRSSPFERTIVRPVPHNAAAPGRAMRTIRLKVKPGSREEGLSELDDGSWLARVKAPPVDGKGHAAVIALVAQHFGLRKAQVNIKSGASGRTKLVQLED